MDDKTTRLIKIRAARAWRPAAGEMIDGTVVTLLKRESEFVKPDGFYPIVIIDNGAENYVAVHAFHSLLLDQLREVQTKPGDEVCIIYQGKMESKNDAIDVDPETGKKRKRTYHAYILVSNGNDASAEFHWTEDKQKQDDAAVIPDEPGF